VREVLRNIPSSVKIVAATKTRSVEEIKKVVKNGVRILGENRVQEAEKKISYFPNVEWHMIGHLQSNKVKRAVKIFSCIQSVDSLKIIEKINNYAERVMPIFLEINIGEEKTKFGFSPETDFENLLSEIKNFENVKIDGLMIVEPYFDNPEHARPYFRKAKMIFDKLKLNTLSMGMSNAYMIAIQEGSNMVRLGTALFGPRLF